MLLSGGEQESRSREPMLQSCSFDVRLSNARVSNCWIELAVELARQQRERTPHGCRAGGKHVDSRVDTAASALHVDSKLMSWLYHTLRETSFSVHIFGRLVSS